jgi:hypothetical protein
MGLMRKLIVLTTLGWGAACAFAPLVHAEPVKVPVETNEKGTYYVAPNVNSTEDSAYTTGGIVGVERKDGSGGYIGTDTSLQRPTYSLGASTGGNVSFMGGVSSDGKNNNGVKAGVKIRY